MTTEVKERTSTITSMPLKNSNLIITPSVFLVSGTDLHKFNADVRAAIQAHTENGQYELEDVKFSTAAPSEFTDLKSRIEFSALLVFKRRWRVR